ELAIVQPHGPDRMVIATTRRRSSALIAIAGRMQTHDAAGLGVLVRDGGTLVSVIVNAAQPSAVPRARRYRLLVVADDGDRPFPRAWNEAVLRWQRVGSPLRSHSAAPR